MAAVSSEGKPFYHFFVVLETDATNAIVTEQLRDGSIGWAVNPSNLEDRNSLAKLLFSVEADGKATVRVAKTLQAMASSKAYAKAILKLIADYNFQGKWGGKAQQAAKVAVAKVIIKKNANKCNSRIRRAFLVICAVV